MAYDTELAARVRAALGEQQELSERKMFGGLAFMLGEHMCCGLIGDQLIVRVGPQHYAAALSHPDAREFDFTGRPMTGFVLISAQGTASAGELRSWVQRGVAFVKTLPPKAASQTTRRRRGGARRAEAE